LQPVFPGLFVMRKAVVVVLVNVLCIWNAFRCVRRRTIVSLEKKVCINGVA